MKVSKFVSSAAALFAALPVVVRGQDSTTIRVSVHVPDSVAHIVDREASHHARFSIVSRDGQAQLLLMDTTIVAQMTDRGLAHMSSHETTDSIKGTANRIFARMALGALTPLFDHGIAYHLRDLADARYEDGRLLLLRANGDEVFRDVEIGKAPLMESFTPAEAKLFAAKARAARAQLKPAPSTSRTRSARPPFDSGLHAELVRLGAEDQVGREDLPNAVARNDTAVLFRFMRDDSARTRRLKQIVAGYGWPTARLVGADGVKSAFLILQHSPDNAWQEAMLPTLERAAVAGDLSRADFSMLTDRVLIHSGKPQKYGNSFSIKNGRLVPDPIEDIDGLDARRAALGLLPMRQFVPLMSEAYHMPVDWPPPKS
jgi:hypothetical protein